MFKRAISERRKWNFPATPQKSSNLCVARILARSRGSHSDFQTLQMQLPNCCTSEFCWQLTSNPGIVQYLWLPIGLHLSIVTVTWRNPSLESYQLLFHNVNALDNRKLLCKGQVNYTTTSFPSPPCHFAKGICSCAVNNLSLISQS